MEGLTAGMEGSAMNKKFWIPTIIELVGIVLMSAGLGYEMAYHADLGYIILTSGSIITAFGGVLYAKFKPWLEK